MIAFDGFVVTPSGSLRITRNGLEVASMKADRIDAVALVPRNETAPLFFDERPKLRLEGEDPEFVGVDLFVNGSTLRVVGDERVLLDLWRTLHPPVSSPQATR